MKNLTTIAVALVLVCSLGFANENPFESAGKEERAFGKGFKAILKMTTDKGEVAIIDITSVGAEKIRSLAKATKLEEEAFISTTLAEVAKSTKKTVVILALSHCSILRYSSVSASISRYERLMRSMHTERTPSRRVSTKR